MFRHIASDHVDSTSLTAAAATVKSDRASKLCVFWSTDPAVLS